MAFQKRSRFFGIPDRGEGLRYHVDEPAGLGGVRRAADGSSQEIRSACGVVGGVCRTHSGCRQRADQAAFDGAEKLLGVGTVAGGSEPDHELTETQVPAPPGLVALGLGGHLLGLRHQGHRLVRGVYRETVGECGQSLGRQPWMSVGRCPDRREQFLRAQDSFRDVHDGRGERVAGQRAERPQLFPALPHAYGRVPRLDQAALAGLGERDRKPPLVRQSREIPERFQDAPGTQHQVFRSICVTAVGQGTHGVDDQAFALQESAGPHVQEGGFGVP
ncbi:hypothetical protein [Streptomyces sp. NPDC007991]|uniref:hypothetical protein n=1 Tax=Streptomyces sp. NPDC007991 TaxID=3364803 RepID=UPI0036EBAF18